MTQDTDRAAREREFHDQRFGAEGGRSSDRFYAITSSSAACYRAEVSKIPSSSKVLELGCGDNAEIWDLADRGAQVTAIDISPVAVDAARERAKDAGLAGLTFVEMNAEELEFDDASFDAVIGSGILHHLDLDRSIPQIARILTAKGRAVFLEPLGLNPALRLYRRVTPSERTTDEHPLLRSDLRDLRRWFEDVDLEFFHLASLAAVPLAGRKSFDQVVGLLDRIDDRVLSRSRLAQDLAWFVVVTLRRPKVLRAD